MVGFYFIVFNFRLYLGIVGFLCWIVFGFEWWLRCCGSVVMGGSGLCIYF